MMFCPKCGRKRLGNELFCTYCGAPLQNNINMLAKENEPAKNVNIKFRHWKFIFIFFLCCLIGGLFWFNHFVGFETLHWKDLGNLDYVTQSNLKIEIDFPNLQKTNEIVYQTNCGTVDPNGLEITWDLTNSLGECEISARYKIKKIVKKLHVIPFINEENLVWEDSLDKTSDEDLDYDNLTNQEEQKLQTNPLLLDSDLDGLNDYEEIYEYKTDPLKADSDGDGLTDYNELELNLSPLKEISLNDRIKDGTRKLNYSYIKDGIILDITGTGNIASINLTVEEKTPISDKAGLINRLYNIKTEGKVEEGKLTIPYTDKDLQESNIEEDKLVVYNVNPQTGQYEKLKTTVDKNKKTLTANLKDFSLYVIGDSSLNNKKKEVLFILDNSWSMYSNGQYFQLIGKTTSTPLEHADTQGLRFSLTSDLIKKLEAKNFAIGLSEFREDYVNILPIGSSFDDLKNKLADMFGKFVTKEEGTNISNALRVSLSNYANSNNDKYIIILTDSFDEALSFSAPNIINMANSKNIHICPVGFGQAGNNKYLEDIANKTGCHYFATNSDSGLPQLYEQLEAHLNDNLVDTNNDGKTNGLLLADSGFVVNKNGLSFADYPSSTHQSGHSYGIALFTQLYYQKKLPLKLQVNKLSYNLTNTIFKNYEDLYKYKYKTDLLKYAFKFPYDDVNYDYYQLTNNKLVINEKYSQEIKNASLFDLKTNQSRFSKEEQLAKWYFNYDEIESAYLNEEKMQKNKLLMSDDLQLLNAIDLLMTYQEKIPYYSSALDYSTWSIYELSKEEKNTFINILKSRLKNGEVPLIIGNFTDGNRAVNVISLIQDLENSNNYHLGIYDSNYPDERRYIDITCQNNQCLTVANEEYPNSNQPLKISPSAEVDLQFFKEEE